MRDDIYDTRPEREGYTLARIKRARVPAWLWRVFCVGSLATWQPWKVIFTRKATATDFEAIEREA
jgi:hypothetical protein